MVLTLPPTPPNRTNPADYSDRADAFLGWMSTFAAQYNADFGKRAGYAGSSAVTAGVVTLNPGFFVNGVAQGNAFTFRVTNSNTGPVLLMLDGTSRSTVTPAGGALPSGYLVANVTYTARRFGSDWVIHRPVQRISNANGIALQYEDGTQICFFNFTSTGAPNTATGSLFQSGVADTWTFPAAFLDTNTVVTGSTGVAGRWLAFSSLTTTSVGINQFSATSTGTTTSLRLMAIGRWY